MGHCMTDPTPMESGSNRPSAARCSNGSKTMVLVAACGAGMLPASALAHIKWFHDYDLAEPPRSLSAIAANGPFLPIFLAAMVVLFVSVTTDRWLVAGDGIVSRSVSTVDDWFQDKFYPFIRILAGIFFIVLGIDGQMMLTPELKSSVAWIPLLQIQIGVCALFASSGVLAGAGILVLYAMCVDQYGVFHMCDYPAFIGAAIYLAWMSLDRRAGDKAIAVLRGTTALTLMIGGVEKLAYPQWTFEILAKYPVLTFGVTDYEFFMVGAGMVEFCLAFLMLTGRVSGKAGSGILFTLMALAIILFGWIDAVGHALFLAALFALTLNRNNLIAEKLSFRGRSGAWKTGALHSGLFAVVLLVLVVSYHLGSPGANAPAHDANEHSHAAGVTPRSSSPGSRA